MRHIFLVPVLLLCMAATAFATDFRLTGKWMAEKENSKRLISIEFHQDGRFIFSKQKSDKTWKTLELRYKVEKRESDSVMTIVADVPVETMKKLNIDSDESAEAVFRLSLRVIDSHTIGLRFIDKRSGTPEDREQIFTRLQ